jgi:hypothetical protein
VVPETEVKSEVRKTGHRATDLLIGLCALFVSLGSLGLAIHQGRAMDRLVEANSQPVLIFEHGNLDPQHPNPQQSVLYFMVENPGAGMARVEWFKIGIEGHETSNWFEAVQLVKARATADGSVAASVPASSMIQSDLAPSYLKAGSQRPLLTWPRTAENGPLWDIVWRVAATGGVRLSACYCSIFDQCWITDSKATWPQQVRSCAHGAPATPRTVNAG